MNWRSWAHAVGLFVGGGLLISLGDRAHIEFGVLVQTDASFFGQAWWVVPMFGVVSLSLLHAYRALRHRFGEPMAEGHPMHAALTAALFLLAYGSTGPFADYGVRLALLLSGLWVVRILLHREHRSTIVLCLLIAVLGPIGEAIVATLGLFHYTNPDFGLVQSWLPAVYLHGGLVIPRVEAFFVSEDTG